MCSKRAKCSRAGALNAVRLTNTIRALSMLPSATRMGTHGSFKKCPGDLQSLTIEPQNDLARPYEIIQARHVRSQHIGSAAVGEMFARAAVFQRHAPGACPFATPDTR